MKRFFNGTAGLLVVLGFIMVGCLFGVVINSAAQVGICHYEGGSLDIDSVAPDALGATFDYEKPPTHHDGEMIALGGGLAGWFVFMILWMVISCNRQKNPRSLCERKVEFSLFSVGIAQLLYGFGKLALLLTGFALVTPFALSLFALNLALIAGVLLYRKELKDIFLKVKDLNPKKARKRVVCKICKRVIPAEYNYCGHCGTPKCEAEVVFCEKCNGLTQIDYNFCGNCGTHMKR